MQMPKTYCRNSIFAALQPPSQGKEGAFGSQHACGSIGIYAMSVLPSSSQERTPPAVRQSLSLPAQAGEYSPEPMKDDEDTDIVMPSTERDACNLQEDAPEREETYSLAEELHHAYMSEEENVPDPGDKSGDENAERPANGAKGNLDSKAAADEGSLRSEGRVSFAWNANARRNSGPLAAANDVVVGKKKRFEDESLQAKCQAAEIDPLTQCWYYLDPEVDL